MNSAPAIEPEKLKQKVIEALQTCYDPEIPVNIYELGLIYDISIPEEKAVQVKMTLTSPHCPVAETLPIEVESKIKNIPEVDKAKVDIVWDPPWTMEMMSEAAKLQLNLM